MKTPTFEVLLDAACARGRRSRFTAPRSRKEVAAACGLSRAYLYLLLRGAVAKPGQHTIERLARGLGCSPKKVREALALTQVAR